MEESQQKPSPMAVIVDVASNPSFSASLKPVCILPISILQEYHQGEYLKAIIMLINKYFSSCHIIVAGTLNKNNFMIKHVMKKTGSYTLSTKEQEEAYQKALSAEKKWIEQHKPLLNFLTVPYELTGWDTWLAHENYAHNRIRINQKFSEGNTFSVNVRKAAQGFVDQKYRFETVEQQNHVRQLAINYILEELAAVLIWNDNHFGKDGDYHMMYPTPHSDVAKKLKELLIDCLGTECHLKFADVKFSKPQNPAKKMRSLTESLEVIKAFSEGLARSGRSPHYIGDCFAAALRSLDTLPQ